METIWLGDISFMGVFCLTGVLSGLFRSLGKGASTLGYLAGAAAVGMLYLPEAVGREGICLLTAAAVFLMTPGSLCHREPVRKEPVQPIFFDFPGKERMAAGRVRAVSEAMERLAKTLCQCRTVPGSRRRKMSAWWKREFRFCRDRRRKTKRNGNGQKQSGAGGMRNAGRLWQRDFWRWNGFWASFSGELDSVKDLSPEFRDRIRRGAAHEAGAGGTDPDPGAGKRQEGSIPYGTCHGKPLHDGAGAGGDGERDHRRAVFLPSLESRRIICQGNLYDPSDQGTGLYDAPWDRPGIQRGRRCFRG